MKVDELRTLVRDLDEFVGIPGGIERLRRTVLLLAFSGKLVTQDPSEGTADDVIPFTQGRTSSMNGAVISDVDSDRDVGALPKSWRWVTLDSLCSHVVDCLHRTPHYTATGFPAIRTSDMTPGKILIANARRVPADEYRRQTQRLVPKAGMSSTPAREVSESLRSFRQV